MRPTIPVTSRPYGEKATFFSGSLYGMLEASSKILAFRRSIFLKLLGTYIASSVIIVLMISGFSEFVVEDNHHAYSEKSRATFAGLLAGKMDPGMDSSLGENLSEQWGMDIALEGPRFSWSTIPDVPPPSKLEAYSSLVPEANGIRMGKFKHHHF